MSKCKATQHSDQMVCEPCRTAWDMNDPCSPERGMTRAIIRCNLYRAHMAMSKLEPALYYLPREDKEQIEVSRAALIAFHDLLRSLNNISLENMEREK